MDFLSFDGVGIWPVRWRKKRSKLYSPGKKKFFLYKQCFCIRKFEFRSFRLMLLREYCEFLKSYVRDSNPEPLEKYFP